MPVLPMLLHRMALVSSRLFCKNLGNLQEFWGQMVYRPPLAENCPYAYAFWAPFLFCLSRFYKLQALDFAFQRFNEGKL